MRSSTTLSGDADAYDCLAKKIEEVKKEQGTAGTQVERQHEGSTLYWEREISMNSWSNTA